MGIFIEKHTMQPRNALPKPFPSSWQGAAKALTALSLAGGIVTQTKLTSNEIKAGPTENLKNLGNQAVFTSSQSETNSSDQAHMILIEGLDLAGKSTLTQSLVTHLQEQGHPVSYSRNALVPDNPIALVADEYRRNQPVSLLETGALFLAAHLKDAIDFKQPTKGFHIQDSSWLRTLAFNELQEIRWIPALVKDCSKHQPVFDLVIYLTASTEVRQQRVLQREQEQPGENDSADYWPIKCPKKFERLDQLLYESTLSFYPNAYRIDTTELTPNQVLEVVLNIIKAHGLMPTSETPKEVFSYGY